MSFTGPKSIKTWHLKRKGKKNPKHTNENQSFSLKQLPLGVTVHQVQVQLWEVEACAGHPHPTPSVGNPQAAVSGWWALLTVLAMAELVNSPALQDHFTVVYEAVQGVLRVITSY